MDDIRTMIDSINLAFVGHRQCCNDPRSVFKEQALPASCGIAGGVSQSGEEANCEWFDVFFEAGEVEDILHREYDGRVCVCEHRLDGIVIDLQVPGRDKEARPFKRMSSQSCDGNLIAGSSRVLDTPVESVLRAYCW